MSPRTWRERVLARAQKPLHEGDERCTPQWFATLVERFVGGPFSVDVCSNEYQVVRARRYLYADDDSLAFNWSVWRKLWNQPPYSDPSPFVARFCEGWERRRARKVPTDWLALMRGDWTTEWFRELASVGTGCLLDRRLEFTLEGETDAGAKFPNVLFYVGNRREDFREYFSPHGFFLDDRRYRRCKRCDGCGRVDPGEGKPWSQWQAANLPDNVRVLPIPCSSCEGAGHL